MHKIKLNQCKISQNEDFVIFPFYKGENSLSVAECGMTVRKCNSMRFRWNEKNPNRDEKLELIKSNLSVQNKTFVPIELIHSQTVFDFSKAGENTLLQGDGIITKNKNLIPTVTVADCMPLYFYDEVSEVFGIVHSGWKGTGIIENALKLANKNYSSKIEDFSVVIGPHIHDCCYIVNEERSLYFSENFTPECVTELEPDGKCFCGGKGLPITWNNGNGKLFRLSLEKANLAVLKKIGVKEENITIIDECTCCNDIFGSNRRETADAMVEGKSISSDLSAVPVFTVQAAFTIVK